MLCQGHQEEYYTTVATTQCMWDMLPVLKWVTKTWFPLPTTPWATELSQHNSPRGSGVRSMLKSISSAASEKIWWTLCADSSLLACDPRMDG